MRFTGYGFQIALKFLAKQYKFAMKEVPIVFKDRTKGTSKMSSKVIMQAFWELIKIRFLKRKVKP